MLKVGVRGANLPGREETAILLEHIVKNYGNHTPDEIKLAFDLAITGKLECEATCYENFSCLYFSKIMNAYREWAREEFKTLPPPVIEKKPDKLTIDLEYACYLQNELIKTLKPPLKF